MTRPLMQIQSISIDMDGDLHIAYVLEENVKANGVGIAHTMIIPQGATYDEEIAALIEAAEYLVADVLDDMPRTPSASQAATEQAEADRAAQEKA